MIKDCTKVFSFFVRGDGLIAGKLRLFMLLFAVNFIVTEAFSQAIKVSGTVTDVKGEPLPGVSVRVKGASTGVSTNTQGKFTINVPGSGAVLSFTFIGFEAREVTVGSQTTINVSLKESSSVLNEVVVNTGYGGTAKKRDLTGPISTIGEKQITERQPVTIFDALQGQAAGVQVNNDNGDPFGQGTIQIRGASSLNSGNGPLYVIDGLITQDASFVNPNDIASFEILKDASTAAIYGARGANGVILITTKRGKEGRPIVQVNYSNVFGELSHKVRTTSADELRYFRRMRNGGDGFGGNVDSVNPYLNADNDFQDLLFRKGNRKVMNINISGASKGVSYYGGVNYTDDESIVINSWMKRLQAKVNVDYQATPKLKISNNLAFSWQTGNQIPVGNSAKQVFERNPWTSIYRPDGSLASYVESKRNPLAFALLNEDVDNDYTVQFNTRAEYNLAKPLKLTTLFNARLDNATNKSFTPSSLTSGGTGDARGSNSFDKNFYWEFQSFLNYDKQFAKHHNVTGLLAFTADRFKNDGYNISMYRYVSEAINTSNAGLIDLTATGTSAAAYSDASVFGRLGYNYKSRYILQGTIRRDGSSKFGENNKWGTFLSASAAWRLSDEAFMKWSKPLLNDAKLRFGVGQAGNDAIGNYSSYTLINFGEEYYNGNSSAAESSTLGNDAIQWETTTSKNLGLDLQFLKGRVNFVADYYTKTTSDLLYRQEIPKETGKSTTTINLGSVVNKGLEFTLGGTPVAKKNFNWEVSANISFQRGKVKELANGTPFISGNIWRIEEGGKIGDMFMWKNLGVYQYDVSNAYSADGSRLTPVNVVVSPDGMSVTGFDGYTLNGQPYNGTVFQKKRNGVVLQGGDTEWYDANNDGIIDDNDKVIVGNGIPNYYFGISNNIRYKNFSLSFLFNGQVGNEIYNKVRNDQNAGSSTYTPPIWDAATTAWSKQGDLSKYPYWPRRNDRQSIMTGYNSLYIEDGTFIRLTSARLTYTLNSKVASSLKLKGVSVYTYGQNLLTWTNYSWYDPEFSSSGLNIGQDGGKYPKRREIGFGVNVNF
ncbi:SusC/RagA family TonB-linked outer membrane protein [Desertivirga arenae]|uniref:SusC/RagA family TonB-linked outer membrane protein n=1 Tax=Desertivirga arenae TaxID=2810309 RepID=UPI001A96AD30|nr:TonB-dependent receptor [Pedobacter sp. SYSU D00823]